MEEPSSVILINNPGTWINAHVISCNSVMDRDLILLEQESSRSSHLISDSCGRASPNAQTWNLPVSGMTYAAVLGPHLLAKSFRSQTMVETSLLALVPSHMLAKTFLTSSGSSWTPNHRLNVAASVSAAAMAPSLTSSAHSMNAWWIFSPSFLSWGLLGSQLSHLNSLVTAIPYG